VQVSLDRRGGKSRLAMTLASVIARGIAPKQSRSRRDEALSVFSWIATAAKGRLAMTS